MSTFYEAESTAIFAQGINAPQNVIPYAMAAVATLLVYDYLCTFEQEVEYVWTAPFSFGTVLFGFNRYLPFIDTFMLLNLLTTHKSPKTCSTHFKTLTWFIVVGSIISEIVLMLRTYAIWERKRFMLYTLIALSAITFIPAIVITRMELDTLIYGPSLLPGRPGCFLYHAGSIIYVAYILIIFCESVIFVLTMIKAVQHLRRSRSPWVQKFYADGLLFYVYLLAISVANIIIPITAPRVYSNGFASPQRVLHSLFCNRVLLWIFRHQRLGASSSKPAPEFSSIFSTTQGSAEAHNQTFTENIDLQVISRSNSVNY